MQNYIAQKFDIPALAGISQAQIDAHIALYEGYVKHTNLIFEKIQALDPEADVYLAQELGRRLGFEWNGMRLHEFYFGALVGGPTPCTPESSLGAALIKQFGDYEKFADALTEVGMSRGSGWALLYWDHASAQFLIHWADEHHLGHLATLPVILALDCWEHAYMIDHDTTGRKKYIESYLANLNWSTINNWFEKYQ